MGVLGNFAIILRLFSMNGRPVFAKVGKNFTYARDCIFDSPKMMEFGDYCFVGPHAVF